MKIKNILIFFAIFLGLICIAPFLFKYRPCTSSGNKLICILGKTERKIVFPVYATFDCKFWHKSYCTGSLLPDEYERPANINPFLNYENAIIIILLLTLSTLASSKFGGKNKSTKN